MVLTGFYIEINSISDDEPVKISAFFQWTLSRLQINLYSQDLSRIKDDTSVNYSPDIKMVINMEDMFTSCNLLRVYMKTEVKISSANIYQYKLTENIDGNVKWELGPFLGLVMRSQDDDINTEPIAENQGSFFKLTMTRARCDHAHSKWGASRTKIDQRSELLENKITYITEIDVAIQPIDILVSIIILRNFIQNFYNNLLDDDINSGDTCGFKTLPKENSLDKQLYGFNNHQLPLFYLDCRSLRIIMPANELIQKSHVQDVCIFQVSSPYC